MKDVLIPETIWPCWAYAIRRIGANIRLSEKWVYEDMPKLLQKYNEDAQTGDILVWKGHKSEKEFLPCNITKQGNIIYKYIKYDYHAAVYEGDFLVSDMIVGIDKDWSIPFIIRMRNMEDLSRPNFIIKGLQNGNIKN